MTCRKVHTLREKTDLSRNQHKALRSLLSCPSVRAAALDCGLSERALYGYLGKPAFCDALRVEQDKLTTSTVAALAGGAQLALETLAEVMTDKMVIASSRVTAAVAWLRAWRDAVEIDDLTQRIELLEARE